MNCNWFPTLRSVNFDVKRDDNVDEAVSEWNTNRKVIARDLVSSQSMQCPMYSYTIPLVMLQTYKLARVTIMTLPDVVVNADFFFSQAVQPAVGVYWNSSLEGACSVGDLSHTQKMTTSRNQSIKDHRRFGNFSYD